MCSKQEEVIDNLRESNPFGDWNKNKAHVVFDKLFKNSDEHKLRQSKIQKEESIKKNNKLNRCRSFNKINDSLKNIEKMVELAGSQLKNSQKKRMQEQSNKKPPIVLTVKRPSIGKPKLSFTLK
jgi:ribosomal protein L14E/L6E/L27E